MSFSFRGQDLSFLIPTIYALTPEGCTIYIISPWLNITTPLAIPWSDKNEEISFYDFVVSERMRGVASVFYVSDMANNEHETQESIKKLNSGGFKVEVLRNLHSKAVIGSTLMYQGSANITRRGLYTNKENVVLSHIDDQGIVLRRMLS